MIERQSSGIEIIAEQQLCLMLDGKDYRFSLSQVQAYQKLIGQEVPFAGGYMDEILG